MRRQSRGIDFSMFHISSDIIYTCFSSHTLGNPTLLVNGKINDEPSLLGDA